MTISDTPAPPAAPAQLHELVRYGLRHRWTEAIGVIAFPVLLLTMMGAGSLLDDAWWWGIGLLSLAAAIALIQAVRVRRRYGKRGARWVERLEDHIARPLGWQEVDVWFATPATWHARSERQVLVALRGGEPFVMSVATRGTAATCVPGPGWLWGNPRRGQPLVVHLDGLTLWCVGPAGGRLGVAIMRLSTKVSPVVPLLWLDRPGDVRSSLKPW